MKIILFVTIILSFFSPANVFGHDQAKTPEQGIVEKTGSVIPADIYFRDENGAAVKLGDIITKPTILSLVYLTCDHICPQLLGGLAVALPGLKLHPGKDYQLITVSFDPNDDPALASQKKGNYIKATGMSLPGNAWRFLTGDRESIRRLTESAGFHFRQESHGYIHPSVLIFLSPNRVITQYYYLSKYRYGAEYPISFSSAELNASIEDAKGGAVRLGINEPVLYCFPHQPEGQEKFFNMLNVTGAVTLLSVAAFFVYLSKTSGRSG